MSTPYVGEIRMFAGNFAPVGWMLCQGQPLPISEYDTLFALIGTTYGGDGQETFNLPNLASRIPIHMGTGKDGSTYDLGQVIGAETVTLAVTQIPNHSHPLTASTATGSQPSPIGGVLASTGGGIMLYYEGGVDGNMNAAAVVPVGGSQPHDNMQPYLCVNFIISLYGIFPPHS